MGRIRYKYYYSVFFVENEEVHARFRGDESLSVFEFEY